MQPGKKSLNGEDALFAHMQQGAVVVTPNNRLSNQLLRSFFKRSALKSMEKPRCLPYSSFLHQLFQHVQHLHPCDAHPILLTNHQQRHLWRSVLTRHHTALDHVGLLEKVQDAWTRCQHWLIAPDHASFIQTPQTLQFQQWLTVFNAQLRKHNAITTELLVSYLLRYPNIFDFHTIIWACFDDYTPAQRQLQLAIENFGLMQYHYDIEQTHTPSHQYAANDLHDERVQLVFWLKARLQAGDQHIGVVVPDLQTEARALMRFFQHHFSPEQISISLGNSLNDFPVVSHALIWLTLDKQVLNHQARLLLHSPFLASAKKECMARSDAMMHCPVLQEALIPLPALIDALNPMTPKLANLLSTLHPYPTDASIKDWCHHFKTRLILLGFPGEYSLNSATYQCFQRFMALFDELLQISLVCPIMTKKQALATLEDLAKNTVFQTKKPTTPIQVLGLLEASGCTFDSVWVSGLTDQCLPKKTNLSAFIPIELQKTHQMPHALPERELQFAQLTLQRLQHASLESIFSYPQYIGDIPNLPSPLIIHLPHYLAVDLQTPPSNTKLIERKEHYLLPRALDESLSGGTTLLANQAKCPFRGFAAHRLHAKSESNISAGPDASERGQIVHQVMEILWHRIKNQHTLNTLAQETITQYIEEAILTALKPLIKKRHYSFSLLIQDIEKMRLKTLVQTCLNWEKQRPPFTIEALEKTFTIELAGLPFQIRVDRLDKSDDGTTWVIDYKTSIPVKKPWNEDRPEAPQLLLYALLNDTINTILFVELKAGRVACSGLSEEDVPIKGIYSLEKGVRWRDRKSEWHTQLSNIAQEFKIGHCPPQPTSTSTCLSCEFSDLCRIG